MTLTFFLFFLLLEARTHGVGYYGFSTDETERARQQAELRNLRKETQKLQAETQTAAQRKQKLMEKRLQAARRRKRERLGLPPEEENPEGKCKYNISYSTSFEDHRKLSLKKNNC